MKTRSHTLTALTLGLITTTAATGNAHGASLDEAIAGGTTHLDMRLRFESVDDSVNQTAKGLSLRTRLGYATGSYQGLTAYGEYEDVRTVFGIDDFAPLKPGHAVIADPPVTQLNQGFILYEGVKDTRIKAGRQRLILDNARFVGNVGWRQNEQTFDAVSLVYGGLPRTTITYAYLDKVKGILKKFDADVTDHLVNVRYQGLPAVTLSGYAYLLEDDDSGAKNDTYGLRAKGAKALTAVKLLYTAEFATQSTDANDATYTFLEGGAALKGVTFKLGYEILGSDSGAYGFQTPLATKHAFNGWADQFLSTPADGLQDLMLSVGGKLRGAKLLAVYHRFSADAGGADYGSELDLLAARKLGKRYLLGAKYAGYQADSLGNDTTKFWLWGQLKL